MSERGSRMSERGSRTGASPTSQATPGTDHGGPRAATAPAADSMVASNSALLDRLTPSQRDAVSHVAGPLLILAGPGSGKTRVVTHRVAHLIEQGVPSYQIVALTFTNKAADELRTRLEVLAPGQQIWAGTFHSFCARLLRQYASMVGLQHNFSIFDIDDQKKTIKQAIERHKLDLGRHSPEQVRGEISQAKNNLVAPDAYPSHGGDALRFVTSQVYPAYQELLLEANAVDFDDLLMHTALLLKGNPELRATLDDRFRYILVDEYQDTNFAQYAIVHALSIDFQNLAVTGDPDQSIYGWRGATIKNILGFERDFPEVKVVRLEQNFRSTQSILRVADALIRHNVQRKRKQLFTENETGTAVELLAFPHENDEAEQIAERIAQQLAQASRSANEFAVLYRTNAQSRQIERALRLRGIPYQIVKGTEFYQRKEIKDVLAYLLLINNPAHNVAFERIVNVPARKIGKATLEKVRAYAWEHQVSFLTAAREAAQIPGLQKRAAGSLNRFAQMVDRLIEQSHLNPAQLIELVLQETGYREHLQLEDSDEADDRLDNLEELINAAAEFAARSDDADLDQLLQQIALVSDTDGWEDEGQRVTLMTLHAAKGLEFPSVFIVGLEEGILPHQRSRDEIEQLEEERRLLFVGITRAERELSLSLAKYRSRRGRSWPTVPSSFLMELPRDEMHVAGLDQRSYASPQSWDDDFASSSSSFDPYGNDEPAWQIDSDDHDQIPITHAPTKSIADPDGADPAVDESDVAAGDIQAAPYDAGKQPDASPVSDDLPGIRRVPVGVFQEGMLVNHPEYGAGTILSLAGSGNKRMATVEFYADGTKTFRLAFSPLVPAEPES